MRITLSGLRVRSDRPNHVHWSASPLSDRHRSLMSLASPRMVPRLITLVGVCVVAILAATVAPASSFAASCTPAGPPVPGAPLPGSCFEGSDGDQIDSDGSGAGDDRLDWQSVTSQAANDVTIGKNDSQFGPGGS